MSVQGLALVLLAIAAILEVIAQTRGSIETDGTNIRLLSPDPSGSLFFNSMDLLARMAQLEVRIVTLSESCRVES